MVRGVHKHRRSFGALIPLGRLRLEVLEVSAALADTFAELLLQQRDCPVDALVADRLRLRQLAQVRIEGHL